MRKQQNNINIKYILLIPLVILVFFIFNQNDEERDIEIKKLSIEYPPIYKLDRDYAGIIAEYTIGSKYTTGKGGYTKLSNGDKFVITGQSTNSQYRKKDLRDNLQIGDSIYYNNKTTELYIYREDDILYFKLFRDL